MTSASFYYPDRLDPSCLQSSSDEIRLADKILILFNIGTIGYRKRLSNFRTSSILHLLADHIWTLSPGSSCWPPGDKWATTIVEPKSALVLPTPYHNTFTGLVLRTSPCRVSTVDKISLPGGWRCWPYRQIPTSAKALICTHTHPDNNKTASTRSGFNDQNETFGR